METAARNVHIYCINSLCWPTALETAEGNVNIMYQLCVGTHNGYVPISSHFITICLTSEMSNASPACGSHVMLYIEYSPK